MKKVLILEDHPLTLMHLTELVRELNTKCVVFSYENVNDAYKCAMERKMDLFIVDIILDTNCPGDASGLKFVESIRHVEYYSFTPIIFVTSLEDAKSYTYMNLHCYSFIEKPFDTEHVKQTVEQCLKFPGGDKDTKTLYFRKDGIILAVEREDIVYVESINHIIYIHPQSGDVLKIPYITLKKFLEESDSVDMIQCSRSTVVNKKFVRNVDIPNRIIQLNGEFGKVEIGVMFKKYVKDSFK